jgi:RNA polymerase sigma factor (sigma-70 family)
MPKQYRRQIAPSGLTTPAAIERKNMQAIEGHGNEVRRLLPGLLRQHGRKWLFFVQGLLHNRADAEDVLQESIQRVLARQRPLESEDQLRMYLTRVIGNTAIDMLHARSRERNRRIPLQETMYLTPPGDDPHGFAEQKEMAIGRASTLRLIREGLAQLPPKQYEALRITLLEPCPTSMRVACAENGIPYSTLRHRTIQGIRHLRRYVRRRSTGSRR